MKFGLILRETVKGFKCVFSSGKQRAKSGSWKPLHFTFGSHNPSESRSCTCELFLLLWVCVGVETCSSSSTQYSKSDKLISCDRTFLIIDLSHKTIFNIGQFLATSVQLIFTKLSCFIFFPGLVNLHLFCTETRVNKSLTLCTNTLR